MAQSSASNPRRSLQLNSTAAGLGLSTPQLILLALTLLGGAIVGYVIYARATGLNAPPNITTSTYIPAFRSNLTTSISTTGTIESTQQADLTFHSSGQVTEIDVKVGDVVKAGQVLAKQDDTALQSALRSAQAGLTSAQAKLDAAVHPTDADVATAQASVATAQSKLATDQKSLSDLQAGPAASDVVTAQQGVLSAENSLQSAEDAYQNAQVAVANDTNTLQQAQDTMSGKWSDLQQAQSDLGSAQTACGDAPSTPVLPSLGAEASSAPFVPVSVDCNKNSDALTKYNAASKAYDSAASAYNSSISGVTSAQTALSKDNQSLAEGNMERSIQNAQLSLQAAQQKLQDTMAGPTDLDVQQAQAGVQSDQASVASAQAKLDQLLNPPEDQLVDLQNSVAQAQDSVTTAQQNLDNSTIVAPFDGTISALGAAVGDNATASTAVVSIVNPDLIQIAASVDQTDVPNVKVGQTAVVTFDALPNDTYEATVSSIGLTPTVSSGVVTYAVLFSIDTSALPAGSPIPSPGMTATLDVTTNEITDALVVPTRSVSGTGNFSSVRVKTDTGNEVRAVTTGISNGTLTQILSGLNEGDEVVYTTTSSASSSSSTTTTQQTGTQRFTGGGGAGGGFFIPGGGGGAGGGR